MLDDPTLAETQPIIPPTPTPAEETRPLPVQPPSSAAEHLPAPGAKPKSQSTGFLAVFILLGAVLGMLVLSALLPPTRANILLLGIDQTSGSAAGRSDAMILATVRAWEPYLGMLSIPRDLWVSIPGGEDDRINTAHYFAESLNPGSGPAVAMQTVRTNFEVDVHYYVRIRFEGLRSIVDALGGVPIELEQPTGVLPAGRHVLDGRMALIFLRDRLGSEDISRMQRGQLFLRAVGNRLLDPRAWPRIPFFIIAVLGGIETDMPPWVLAKIALTLALIGGPQGIDARLIGWEMVDDFITPAGASVLAPNWIKIDPLVQEMFGP